MNYEVSINGETHNLDVEPPKSTDGLPYVVIRTNSAGVHVGYMEYRNGKEVKLINSRRLHYWMGACSLSQIAIDGMKSPEKSRVAMVLPMIILTEAIEIINATESAKKVIEGAEVWKS